MDDINLTVRDSDDSGSEPEKYTICPSDSIFWQKQKPKTWETRADSQIVGLSIKKKAIEG